MSFQTQIQSTVSPPLSQVVHTGSAAVVADNKSFRHYGATLVARSLIKELKQTNRVAIQYRVGMGGTTRDAALKWQKGGVASTQLFKPNEVSAGVVTAMARKYSNFTGQFSHADLSGPICRLAQCIGIYALTKKLSFADLKDGMPTKIRTLSVLDDPVAATPRSVFVPRVVSDTVGPDVFSALVGAVNATGSTVITDVCDVDANNNAPVIRVPSDSQLAIGCVHALRLLFSMYEESDAGAIAAVAYYVGIHKAITVVGHTDEGAYVRDMWRAVTFGPPRGGVYCSSPESFVGLPMPDVTNFDSFVALADGSALLSAGLSAISDPLVTYKGKRYPTIVAAQAAQLTDGKGVASDADYSLDLTSQVASGSSVFCRRYAVNLARSLMLNDGGADIASVAMESGFNELSGRTNRHLKLPVAAPFYWVEPTSLIHDVQVYDSPAQDSGYGAYAGTDNPATLPYFEDLEVRRQGANVEHWFAGWRTARTCGAVLLHRYNPQDGLGALIIRQASQTGFALRGGMSEDILVTMRRNAPLSEYLWERGDAGLPAPAELVYTGNSIAFLAVQQTLDPLSYDVADANLKAGMDHDDMVHVSVGPPSFMQISNIGSRTAKVVRARTAAAASLAATRLGARRRIDALTGGEDLALSGESPINWKIATGLATVSGVEQGASLELQQRGSSKGSPAARVVQMAADKFHAVKQPRRQELTLTVAGGSQAPAGKAEVEQGTERGIEVPAEIQAGGPSSAPPAAQ